MRKRVSFLLLLLIAGLIFLAGCSSYFGERAVASNIADAETKLLMRMDVNNNGEIDNDDFFAFTNAFGVKNDNIPNANGYVYTPDGNYNGYDGFDIAEPYNEIENNDFFLFTQYYGRDFKDKLIAAQNLIGDFNNDKCINEKDLERADMTIEELRGQRDNGKLSDAAYAIALKKYDLDKDGVFWSDNDKNVLRGSFGGGCEEAGGVESIYSPGDEAAKPAFSLDCGQFEGSDKDYCWDLMANDINNLDVSVCENIQDGVLRGYCKERNCLFAGNCAEKTIQAFHADSLEFSSEEYAALQMMDEQAVLGKNIAFTIQAPENARFAKIDFKFEHSLSGKPSIGYFREDTLKIEQASYETFIPLVSVRVDGQNVQYVNYAEYIKVNQWDAFPVVDGKISFKLAPQDRVYTAVSGLRTSAKDTFVLNQLFEKISFAADENALSRGNYLVVMESKDI